MTIGKHRFRPTRRGWIALALVGLVASSYLADAVASINRVRPGVTAGSLDLGSRTRKEALSLLHERAGLIVSKPVELFADTKRITVAPSQIGFLPDAQATLAAAMGVGRRGNVVVRLWHRLRALFAKTDVGWKASYDAHAANALVNDFASRFDTDGHEAGIEARGEQIVPVGAVPARRLDRAGAIRTIITGLESWPRRSFDLPIAIRDRHTTIDDARSAAATANRWVREPITLLDPDGSHRFLSRQMLAGMLEAVPHRRGLDWNLEVRFSPSLVKAALSEAMGPFERDARSATFNVDGSVATIVGGANGRKFDPAATARALAMAAESGDRTASALFHDVAPDLTTNQAQGLNIHELVSTFTTHYPCCAARVTNIHKIADAVDGAIVKPGATFSLNGYVGPRTPEKGYVQAPMIYNGEYKDDTGGGVSQFATTTFNAIFFGGYRFETYQAHSYYISRYPAGREATVSWPHPDLAFTNDSHSGILIKTGYDGTSLTVSFYGDKEGKTVTAETGPRTNFTDPKEERKPNPGLAPGAEYLKQAGEQGFDIVVTRVITQNGHVTRQSFYTKYDAEPKIIEYGPGPSPSPSPSAAPTGSPRRDRTTPTGSP